MQNVSMLLFKEINIELIAFLSQRQNYFDSFYNLHLRGMNNVLLRGSRLINHVALNYRSSEETYVRRGENFREQGR